LGHAGAQAVPAPIAAQMPCVQSVSVVHGGHSAAAPESPTAVSVLLLDDPQAIAQVANASELARVEKSHERRMDGS
jgi:hypothetical protein